MNILIVDDEQIQLDSLETGLKRYDYKIMTALNADRALKMIFNKDSHVDIVISDYSMPGMNGLELLKQIREKNRILPVIMMTAYGEKKLVMELLKYRCDSFIEKPFVMAQLINEIEMAKVRIIQNTDSHDLEELTKKFIHQINNPLMSISGFAEISLDVLDNPEALKRNIQFIMNGVKKIGLINHEIMSLGKRHILNEETIDVRTSIEECVEGFRGLMALKEICLEINLGDEPIWIHGNAFNLEQMFNNLVLNAIDAMDGIVEKKLKISVESLNSRTCTIHIQDTGCGLLPEQKEKIFNSYYTSKKKGTGLGLSVVKDVLQSLNGYIKVDSIPGRETTVILELPLPVFHE